MNKQDLLKKIKARREVLNITLRDLTSLSSISYRTLTRFLAGDDIRLSSLEKLTQFLGLDFAGNEEVNIQILKEKRAEEKALYIVGLVQDTSSLEMQGLNKEAIDDMLQKTKEQFLNGEHQDKLWSS